MKTKKLKEQFSKISVIFFLVSIIALILGSIYDQRKNTYRVQEVFSNTIPMQINSELPQIIEQELNSITTTDTIQNKNSAGTTVTQNNIGNVPTTQNSNQGNLSTVQTTQKVNPFYQQKLFANRSYSMQTQMDIWQKERPQDAEKLKMIADNPISKWIVGGSANDAFNNVNQYVSLASSQGALPVLVAYNIPVRDCNSYSGGGASSTQEYLSWIDSFARGIGSNKAVVILEPDALTLIDCLSSDKKEERFRLLSAAVDRLKQSSNTFVYLDAGHSRWIASYEMVGRLNNANISRADGFSLNTSNFQLTNELIKYGSDISAQIGNKHFVLDTSRNGVGPTVDNEWCNPSGRALGALPTSETGHPLVDAYLWIKVPGESDGNCNGGPNAGQWWPEYALGLINNYMTYVAKTPSVPVATSVQEKSSIPLEWEIFSKYNEGTLLLTGNKVLLSSSIKSNNKSNVANTLVDIEIYNKDNIKVAQRYFESQTFEPGIVKDYTLLWEPTEAGRYIVKVGVFTNDWSKNLVWQDEALVININKEPVLGISTNVNSTQGIEIWWPTNQSRISGVQPFKAVVSGLDLKQYNMYWQVDGGRINLMGNSYEEHPHKEIQVNLDSWRWRSNKTYKVKFIAKDLTGKIFAEKEIELIAN